MTYKDFLKVCDRSWCNFNLRMNSARLEADLVVEDTANRLPFYVFCHHLVVFRKNNGELRPHVIEINDILNAEIDHVDLDTDTVYLKSVAHRLMLKSIVFPGQANEYTLTNSDFNYYVYVNGEETWVEKHENFPDVLAIIQARAAQKKKRED